MLGHSRRSRLQGCKQAENAARPSLVLLPPCRAAARSQPAQQAAAASAGIHLWRGSARGHPRGCGGAAGVWAQGPGPGMNAMLPNPF